MRFLRGQIEGLIAWPRCQGTDQWICPCGRWRRSAAPCPSGACLRWFVTLTVNSSSSPSRKNRGGFGWTMRSLAVLPVGQQAAAKLGIVGEAEELPFGERLGHGELDLHLAVGIGEQMREEEGRLVEVLARGDLAQIGTRGETARAFAAWLLCLFCAELLPPSAGHFIGRRPIRRRP